MKRLLVTGATSFVGRHLLPVLARDYELVCVVRAPGSLDFLPDAQVIHADLSDPAFDRHLPEHVHGILHMAVAPPSLSPEPIYAFQVTVASSLVLLEWGKRVGIERYVFTSTGSVYGPQSTPISEEVCPRPSDLLGVSKYAAEMLAGLYTSYFPTMILRLWRPYGPDQPDNFLIPRLAARIRSGQPIKLYRGGPPRVNATYITDLIEVMQRALHLDESVTLNVAHPEAPNFYELCRELECVVGKAAHYEHVDQEASDLVADVNRLEQVLGFRATVSLADGLRQMWEGEA